jgi:dephospho-CoA kinase
VNIHIREVGSDTSRCSLLFRDYLLADSQSRDTWGAFKVRLAETATDLHSYGQVKATVQPLLMALVEDRPKTHRGDPSGPLERFPVA